MMTIFKHALALDRRRTQQEAVVRDSFEFKIFGLFAAKGEGRAPARHAARLAWLFGGAFFVLLIVLRVLSSF
jgi:hypothetical protein